VPVEVVVASQDLNNSSEIYILKTYKIFGVIAIRLSPEYFALSGIITHIHHSFHISSTSALVSWVSWHVGTRRSGSGAVSTIRDPLFFRESAFSFSLRYINKLKQLKTHGQWVCGQKFQSLLTYMYEMSQV
jgi:hypothetical protein